MDSVPRARLREFGAEFAHPDSGLSVGPAPRRGEAELLPRSVENRDSLCPRSVAVGRSDGPIVSEKGGGEARGHVYRVHDAATPGVVRRLGASYFYLTPTIFYKDWFIRVG